MPEDNSTTTTGDGAIAPGAPSGQAIPPGAVTADPIAAPALGTATRAAPPTPGKKETDKDTFRELVETIVFVVVLVLMLKTFLAEAFVIPTGSMADTLLGYHYKVTCDRCGKDNLINASRESEPPDPKNPPWVVRGRCQNCEHIIVTRPDLLKDLRP
jgi:signal peptidase I